MPGSALEPAAQGQSLHVRASVAAAAFKMFVRARTAPAAGGTLSGCLIRLVQLSMHSRERCQGGGVTCQAGPSEGCVPACMASGGPSLDTLKG